jgi:hypothetical protein
VRQVGHLLETYILYQHVLSLTQPCLNMLTAAIEILTLQFHKNRMHMSLYLFTLNLCNAYISARYNALNSALQCGTKTLLAGNNSPNSLRRPTSASLK